MNLSTNSNERIVLGNLSNSNTNTNFFTGSNTKNRSNSFLAPSKKKVHVDTPFPNKSVPKVNLNGIDKNDPENARYISRIFGADKEENSPIQKVTTWKEKGSINRPKMMEVKKLKVMMLTELPVYEDTVNKKRQLEIEEDEEEKVVEREFEEIEHRFGEPYRIPDVPFDLVEDRLEEKLDTLINNMSFADTFQTFNYENEKASEEENNFYTEFAIDLSFGEGGHFITENKLDEEVDKFLEADLANFKSNYIENIFE